MADAEAGRRIVLAMFDAGVEFILVGGTAAVIMGAPIVTFDVDIVHRRSAENVDRLHAFLMQHGAYHRLDLANRRLPPARDVLFGHGHLNLALGDAKLDVLCELDAGAGYDELLEDSELQPFHGKMLRVLGLRRLIQAKTAAGRLKDQMALPILLATLEAREHGK